MTVPLAAEIIRMIVETADMTEPLANEIIRIIYTLEATNAISIQDIGG